MPGDSAIGLGLAWRRYDSVSELHHYTRGNLGIRVSTRRSAGSQGNTAQASSPIQADHTRAVEMARAVNLTRTPFRQLGSTALHFERSLECDLLKEPIRLAQRCDPECLASRLVESEPVRFPRPERELRLK